MKQADISTFITETEAGELISKASIRADQIDLTGKVTLSMLSSDLQGTLDGKVDTTTIIEGGYIKTSLINADMLVAKGWRLVHRNIPLESMIAVFILTLTKEIFYLVLYRHTTEQEMGAIWKYIVMMKMGTFIKRY